MKLCDKCCGISATNWTPIIRTDSTEVAARIRSKNLDTPNTIMSFPEVMIVKRWPRKSRNVYGAPELLGGNNWSRILGEY